MKVKRRKKGIRFSDLASGLLHVIVYGPGRGEACVVLMPDGQVGVVDGCREPHDPVTGEGDPVREFLADANCKKLCFVCLTHPHSDHYAGLGHLLSAFKGNVERLWTVPTITGRARDVLPRILRDSRAGRPLPDADEVVGLERVIGQIEAAKEQLVDLRHLGMGTALFETTMSGSPLSVRACGPTSSDIDSSLASLIAALDAARSKKKAPAYPDPNLTSGAIVVEWGDSRVLLAGDLLLGGDHSSGWRAAERQAATTRLESKVTVVNVAHHASAEAHLDSLWATMKPDLAIVTPFQHAVENQPPRPEQIKKLSGLCKVAITSPPHWAPTARSVRSRNGIIREAGTGGKNATRNSVGVSLRSDGQIETVFLGGAADFYDEV